MIQFLILAAVTLSPAVVICIYIYVKDSYRGEPHTVLFFSFLLGACTVFPAAFLENIIDVSILGICNHYIITAVEAYFVIGVIEEVLKYFVLAHYATKQSSFDEPFDGIVYSIFISMGFATLENVFYVMQGGMNVAIMRMFTAIPAHATFAVLMGHFYGLSAMKKFPNWYKYVGLAAAIFFHGSYDYFLMINNNTLIVLGAFVSLIVGIRYSLRAIQLHKQIELNSQNHFN
jgi:RsiW-degrading membrane proteinase PrsW (M82 family)